MFSVTFVCLFGGDTLQDPGPGLLHRNTPGHVTLFNLELNVRDSPNMFKLVHYEVLMVSWLLVGIRMKCLLVLQFQLQIVNIAT